MRAPIRLLLVAAALGAPPATASAQDASAVAVIVDRDNPRDGVTSHELRAMFLGKRRDWGAGVPVVPLDLGPGSAARAAFERAILRMDADAVEQYWAEAKVRGEGTAPKSAPSAGVLVKLVARVRGAIGYVPLSAVDGSVKVLKVDGVAPGQPGYPVQRN